MNTDLDNRLTHALTDAAATTVVNDDALDNIVARSTTDRPTRSPRRVTILVGALVCTAVVTGATYGLIQHLNPDQTQIIEQIGSCGADAANARMVATTEHDGRIVDYWVVDGQGRYGDFLFERNNTGGGGGCAPAQTRHEAHPTLPWANYLLATGNGTGQFWFYGQAPKDAASVRIVMSTGTAQATVGTDGYYVVLADLPWTPTNEHLERVEALSDDGDVIATGGLS